ncbi:hypothetical protein [Asticcacaulis sp.]|uniref:hypothetical protein n=1 Tax=Asticcacaulis sp. TaxID=1872648 RepID=UPI00391C8A34
MMKSIFGTAAAAALLTLAVPAFAECDVKQEQMVGKAIVDSVRGEGEELAGPMKRAVVELDRCEGGSIHFDTRFRVKAVLESGKLVWVEGHAKGVNDQIESIEYYRASTELAAMTRSTGLASR